MTNESNDHRARSAPGMDGVDAERLISRIVDGEATDAERAEFERLASESPELLEELAATERAHGLLAGAVAAELDALASIGPAGGVAGGGIGGGVGSGGGFAEAGEEARSGLRRRIGLVGAWGGWGVAAALLLGMFLPLGEGVVAGGGAERGIRVRLDRRGDACVHEPRRRVGACARSRAAFCAAGRAACGVGSRRGALPASDHRTGGGGGPVRACARRRGRACARAC